MTEIIREVIRAMFISVYWTIALIRVLAMQVALKIIVIHMLLVEWIHMRYHSWFVP